jgi:hypothetical protein
MQFSAARVKLPWRMAASKAISEGKGGSGDIRMVGAPARGLIQVEMVERKACPPQLPMVYGKRRR